MKKLLFLLLVLAGCTKDLPYDCECITYLSGVAIDTTYLTGADQGFINGHQRGETYYWNSRVITPGDSVYVTICREK